MRFISLSALLVICLLCVGCDGQKLKPVQGKVTYGGEPIASGVITFVPDGSKGNNGAGTAAEIKDGQYTLAKKFGIVGGHYHVIISGNDGVVAEDFPVGKPLFPDYKIKYEFKDGETTFDADVPRKK